MAKPKFTIPKTNIIEASKFIFSLSKNPYDMSLLIIGILFNIAIAFATPFFLLYFGKIIDSFSTTYEQIVNQVIIICYVGIYSAFCGVIGVFCLDLFTSRLIKKLKVQYFMNILRQEIGFHDQNEPGSLTSTLDISIADIRNGLSLKFSQMVMMLTMVIGVYIVAFIINWQLTLVTSASLLLLPISLYAVMYVIAESSKRAQKSYADAGSIAEEVFTGIRTVVSLNAQSYFVKWYDKHIDKAKSIMQRFAVLSAVGLASMDLVVNCASALGFWYGGMIILDSIKSMSSAPFTIGDVVIVNFSVITAGFALGQAGSSINSVFKGFSSIVVLKKTIERKSLIDPLDESGQKQSASIGDIEFHNVSFYFPSRPDVWVFKNLSFKIKGGNSVAFVGPSGIGKSTVIQLLQRYYDPIEGYITIDDIPLKDYNIHSLRRSFGVVSQQPRLLSLSVKENISIVAEKPINQKDIIEAAKDSLAHDFITKFTNGYDTEVGEGGSQLSGGQKQRIAIARALINKPPILLFDEATSSLDNVSEKLVQKTLDKLISEKSHTSILVAHRLSTIKNSDQIIVLHNPNNQGAEIAQIGNFEELMSDQNGLFYSLMNSQNLDLTTHSETTDFTDAPSESLEENDYPIEYENEAVIEDISTREKSSFLRSLILQFRGKKKSSVQSDYTYESYPSYRLFLFMRKDSIYLTIGFISSFFGGFTYPLTAIVLAQYLFDALTLDLGVLEESNRILPILLVALGAFGFITSFLQIWSFLVSGENLVRTLRHKAFSSIMNQEIEFFDSKENSPGQLSTTLAGDTQLIQTSAGMAFGMFLKSGVVLIVGLALAFYTNAKMAAVALGFSILMFPGQYFEQKFLMVDNASVEITSHDKKNTKLSPSAIISEVISQIRTVASFGMEKKMYERYLISLESFNMLKNSALLSISWGYSQGCQFWINAAIFWYGGLLISRGEGDPLEVFRVIFVLMFATMGASQAGLFLGDQKKASESRAKVFGMINRVSKIDPSDDMGVRHVFSDVELRDLEFFYTQRPDIKVLDDISFFVPKNETYALVGESGCGKSTIIQLLERFYDSNLSSYALHLKDDTSISTKSPNGGIFYTQKNIKELNINFTRTQLGLVSQEPILFNTTIAENIKLGKLDATHEEIVRAATIANASHFIESLPNKYDTKVGRLGELLSGGQKQRVVIARSIIKNPSILLLDEATSALDTESEKVVQAALDNLMLHSPRTTLVIAHRLSTIRNADKIIVLKASSNIDGSHIVESGTHDELLQKKGEYFKLCSSQ